MPKTVWVFMLGVVVGSTGIPTTTFAQIELRNDAKFRPNGIEAALREATIVLHVVNYAALPGDILNGAKGRVEMVYERIGVRILWVDSDRPVKKHQDGGLHLTVMLLSRNMVQKKTLAEGISDGALGQAHFASGRAHIFCDRIATMRGANPLAIQLGAVIAHEVGHLVLPENSHSPSGVMRADMDAQHAIHLQNFDKTQARTIHAALKKPSGQR